MFLILLLPILSFGCNSNPTNPVKTLTQEITGRDEGTPSSRLPIYRVKVPEGWVRRDPPSDESIIDTKLPLCEFTIPSNNNAEQSQIRITIHNFPVNDQKDRIPITAQVARWKRQLTNPDPVTLTELSQSYGGFTGIFFEGTGSIADKAVTILAWAMQPAPEHISSLELQRHLTRNTEDNRMYKQMGSDYTIKAVGSPEFISIHKHYIVDFAHSFELIQEIPSSS